MAHTKRLSAATYEQCAGRRYAPVHARQQRQKQRPASRGDNNCDCGSSPEQSLRRDEAASNCTKQPAAPSSGRVQAT
eukprot:2631851-Alexandrium_andersonii.AAC.1